MCCRDMGSRAFQPKFFTPNCCTASIDVPDGFLEEGASCQAWAKLLIGCDVMRCARDFVDVV